MRRQNHEDVSMAPSGREQVSVCDSVCGSLVISVRPSVRPSCVQTFKIALTVFDCARGRCPAYFSDICVPVHSLLDVHAYVQLIIPRVQTQCYGSRSFCVSGPTVWNSLPQNLRSSDISREQFKRGLKTWLFERAYV